MKVLAVDYGSKKVGLAISDELGMVAAKLPVLRVNREEDKIEGLEIVVRDNNPDVVLFGVPNSWEGKETEQSKVVREFMKKVVKSLEVLTEKNLIAKMPEIKTWDESFSSKDAERGKSKKFKKNKSDSEAARLMLLEYLNSQY